MKVQTMVRKGRGKRALNRKISASAWGLLLLYLSCKCARIEKVNPAYTSQMCSRCGHIAKSRRKPVSGAALAGMKPMRISTPH